MKKMLDFLSLVTVSLGTMVASTIFSSNNQRPNAVYALDSISYLSRSWDGLTGSIKDEAKECHDYEIVTSNKKDWFNGWYVVNNSITISERIIVSGTINLILCDGITLTADKGIHIPEGAALNIYSQFEDTGTVVATGFENTAGIGGSSLGANMGNISIYGGRVIATGGQNGAGIGGGNAGAGGTVSIYGGRVKATGGIGASGIGSGRSGNGGGANRIYCGTVDTVGNYPGFGISGSISVPDSMVVLGNETQAPYYLDDQQTSSDYFINRWQYMTVMHKHNWSYVANGDALTASCSYHGCVETEGLTLTVNAGSVEYDGSDHKAASIKPGYNPIAFANPSISYYQNDVLVDECVNAGTYEARVTYGDATAAKRFTIEKACPLPLDNNYPEPVDGLVYNGSYQYLIKPGTGVSDGGTYMYKVGTGSSVYSDDGEWTISAQAKDVGTYIVRIKIFGDSNHTDAEAYSYAIDISKADSGITTVPTVAEDLVYDGTAHELLASVGEAAGGTMQFKLEDGETFSTDIPTATDAGTYIINYYAKSNDPSSYLDSDEFSVIATIKKASINPTVNISDWAYNDEPNNPVLTGNLGNGEVVYEYKEVDADDSAYSSTIPTEVGSYVVKATIEETANYLGSCAICGFNIIKAAPTDYDIPTDLVASYGDKLSTVALPKNWSWKSPDDLVGDVGDREHVAIYTPVDSNYKEVEETLNVQVVTIGPTGYDIPADLVAVYGQTLADVELPTNWTWFEPNTKLDKVGTNYFTAIYTPTDPNYHYAMDVLTLNVIKATPTGYDIPTNLVATYGDKLSTVALPENWSWKSPDDLVGDVGDREHIAIYTPVDSNYKEIEETLTISVKEATTPIIPDDPTKNSGLPVGALVGIIIGSSLAVAVGGFSLVWFAVKKKTWADFIALFKKKR